MSNRMREMRPGWRIGGLLAVCLLGLSGCLPWPSAEPEKIAMPPYIPTPPDKTLAGPLEAVLPPGMIDMYSDLMDPSDTSIHPELREAVYQAIERGVLKPVSLEDRFEPKNTITFYEFRQWAQAFQQAPMPSVNPAYASVDASATTTSRSLPSYDMTATSETRPTATSPGKFSRVEVQAGAPRELTPARPTGKPDRKAVGKALPDKIEWGSVQLSGKMPMTREMLLGLYVMLSDQETKARAMRTEEMEAPDEKGPLTKALANIKDAAAISPWARQLVAVAVQDKALHKIFNLTPEQLKTDAGLNPQQPVTREEALMLLHHLYGSREKHLREGMPRPAAPGTAQNPARPAPMIHVPPEN